MIEYRSKRRSDDSVEVRLFFPTNETWTGKETWPKRHLDHLSVHLHGVLILEAGFGPGIAPEPFFALRIDDTRPGDRLEIHWRTNQGQSGVLEIILP